MTTRVVSCDDMDNDARRQATPQETQADGQRPKATADSSLRRFAATSPTEADEVNSFFSLIHQIKCLNRRLPAECLAIAFSDVRIRRSISS
jgi:hypothetical protein